MLPTLRQAFPHAVLRVRLDGGFACPDVFNYLDRENVQYLVGMAKNSVLSEMAAPALAKAKAAFEAEKQDCRDPW